MLVTDQTGYKYLFHFFDTKNCNVIIAIYIHVCIFLFTKIII